MPGLLISHNNPWSQRASAADTTDPHTKIEHNSTCSADKTDLCNLITISTLGYGLRKPD